MTDEIYLKSAKERIEDVDHRITAARERLQSGAPSDQVRAAAELTVLERQHECLTQKLMRLQQHPDEAAEDFKAELEDHIEDALAGIMRWMETH
jgi:DNA repair exonuclease SbcCD ATPase subunit